jgi:hypothetical protein
MCATFEYLPASTYLPAPGFRTAPGKVSAYNTFAKQLSGRARGTRIPAVRRGNDYSSPSGARVPNWRGTDADGPAGNTAYLSRAPAASETMSIRQPVSLAASRAFWPSLPMARESW